MTLLDESVLYISSEQYNQYVELVGGAIGQGACAAVRRGNRIYTIADDLPLVHFLSDFEVCDNENLYTQLNIFEDLCIFVLWICVCSCTRISIYNICIIITLSITYSPQDEGEGNDWLYAVIRDIAEAQNLFVQTLYAGIGENERNHPLARLLPSEVTHIYPAEANEHSCIVGKQQMWAIYLSIHLSIYLSNIYLFIYLSIYLSIYPSIHLSI